MRCPFCNDPNTQVIDSRDTDNLVSIRRRRECLSCHKRFTTYERVESVGLRVIKKDGSQEEFDPEKLKKGISKSCEKTPVTADQIQKIVETIEAELLDYKATSIPSRKIGQLVMKHLKKINQIAYVRYASVYEEFKDVEDFETEVSKLLGKKS